MGVSSRVRHRLPLSGSHICAPQEWGAVPSRPSCPFCFGAVQSYYAQSPEIHVFLPQFPSTQVGLQFRSGGSMERQPLSGRVKGRGLHQHTPATPRGHEGIPVSGVQGTPGNTDGPPRPHLRNADVRAKGADFTTEKLEALGKYTKMAEHPYKVKGEKREGRKYLPTVEKR